MRHLEKNDLNVFVISTIILSLAVGVNIGQFASIDSEINDRYSAINRYDTHDVLEIGFNDSPHFRQAYGMYLSVAQISSESKLIIPANSPYSRAGFRTNLFGFANINSLVEKDYKYTNVKIHKSSPGFTYLLESINLPFEEGINKKQIDTSLSFSFEGTELNGFIFASDTGGSRGVPWAIITEEKLGECNPNEKTFVMMQWNGPLAEKTGEHRLLIDYSIIEKNDLERFFTK